MTGVVSKAPLRVRELPTLSVVIPNYNHARYLEAALNAHLSQTAPPFEIIVVDDASTDESREIVERVAATNPSLRLIRLARNVGVNGALRPGLCQARGDYVCLSAADDLVTPDFAARSLEVLMRHPSAAFCFSNPAELAGDTGEMRHFALFLSDAPTLFSPDDIERLMRRNLFTFSSNTVVYRRETLIAAGGLIEDLHWQADWFLNLVLALRHGACYVPAVLAYCRLREQSYSARGLRQTGMQRELLYRILDLLRTDRFADVATRFQAGALAPEYRVRTLYWLLASARHRQYLTFRLAGRFIAREMWSAIRPLAPVGLRRAARWIAARPTRKRVAGRARSMLATETDP